MNDEQKLINILERKKKRIGHMKFPPNDQKIPFKIKDYVYLQQSTFKDKYFVLDLIELQFDAPKEEIRIGYYIKGKMPRMKGKWVWGQYCPIIPREDLEELLKKARKNGIIK